MPDWSAAVTLPIDRHRFLKVSICNRLMLKSALQRLLPLAVDAGLPATLHQAVIHKSWSDSMWLILGAESCILPGGSR